jgi:hypothetical protein
MDNPNKCAECRFFRQKEKRRTGLCVGAPPTPIRGDFKMLSVFPMVERHWWCGRFEVKAAPEPEPGPEATS